jgi:hypothetical protein
VVRGAQSLRTYRVAPQIAPARVHGVGGSGLVQRLLNIWRDVHALRQRQHLGALVGPHGQRPLRDSVSQPLQRETVQTTLKAICQLPRLLRRQPILKAEQEEAERLVDIGHPRGLHPLMVP